MLNLFKTPISAFITLTLCLGASLSFADEVAVAAAANFSAAVKQLAPLFERKTGHKVVASFGATGQLYAQINNGAPFDVFLSADTETAKKLIDAGLADRSSYFVYAIGQLALWSARPQYIDGLESTLKRSDFEKFAIANPKTAPYGAAAIETLDALKLHAALEPQFVVGENIAQTLQFVSSGNATMGFVALAQIMALPDAERGSFTVVPDSLHKPIEQAAVLVATSRHRDAAAAWLAFLKSPQAAAILKNLGYATPVVAL